MQPTVTERRTRLRHLGRDSRRSLDIADRTRYERRITTTLLELIGRGPGIIGLYLSDDGEPHLGHVASALWDRSIATALPVVAPAPSNEMEFRAWRHDDPLTPGRFGIPSPPEGAAVEPSLVLVPLVAFDPAGNRLGRGAGFYDRWLASRSVITVGVAFEGQRVSEIPAEQHDVSLNAVVTDMGIRYPSTPQ